MRVTFAERKTTYFNPTHIMRLLISTWLLLSVVAMTASAAEPVDYVSDIVPILEKYCVGCHTEGDASGGLSMDTHELLLSGGDSGVAVTGGEADSSRLLLLASGKMEPVMPPDGEPGPNEDELATLTEWIKQGAPGPDGDTPTRKQLRTPEIPVGDDVSRPITSIAISDDGKFRAIARFRTVELLDQNEQVVATIADQPGKVNSIRFNRDASRLLLASGLTGAYGYAAIHEIPSGKLLTEFTGHRDTLYAAVFSPDGKRVATAGYDREIVLWDAQSGEPIRNFTGHNGAIFDLAFAPDGKVLASACADETVKIWQVDTGKRLDTLSQPEGEVLAVGITPDGKHVLAGSADNRLRVWRLVSQDRRRINPIVATRFVDESPLVQFELTPDGKSAVVLSKAGNVKVIRTSDWNQYATLDPLGDVGSDLSITPDGKTANISLMDGRLVTRQIPPPTETASTDTRTQKPIYMDLGPLEELREKQLRETQSADPSLASMIESSRYESDHPVRVGRGVQIQGVIERPDEGDLYQWQASAGEVWAIDADPTDGSPLDPVVTVLDSSGQPVLRTRLQAVRDSYFTFRGKDSEQIGDFRLFNWQEMNLGDYLYAAGEVTRLWLHPRGPDSGFNVYPGEGKRWTYFGTTHSTHALGEPAYIVRPLQPGQPPLANGLPVFDVYYENDDDPMRRAGTSSRLLFQAPEDDRYFVRVGSTTGSGGESFGYELKIRPAAPGFQPSVTKANGTLRKGTGREFIVRADRMDGFDGPVVFDMDDLPPPLKSNAPITIEPGQRFAVGTIWVGENASGWEGKLAPELVAHATVAGRHVERRVGKVGEFTLGERPSVIPSIQPGDRTVAEDENWTLPVARGETVSARVVIRRKEGFDREISFGKEDSGRNASQGVYVDNIGLNGLLLLEGMDQREFFLTADPTAVPGKRSFFLKANVDGGVTTHPITVEVLP